MKRGPNSSSATAPKAASQASPPKTPQEEFLGEWRRLLEKSGRKPTHHRVHALRVLTLRVQVLADAWAASGNAPPEAQRLARRWKKRGGWLRRHLRPVREADVFLARIETLRAFDAAPSADLAGFARLRALLESVRSEAAEDLVRALERRTAKLDRLGRKAESAVAGVRPRPAAVSRVVRAIVASAAAEFPSLDAACLHDFRKRIKHARYLAEYCQHYSPSSDSLAAVLRQIVEVAGEWHDWQQLRTVADRLSDAHADCSGLAAALAVKEAESLESALDVCRRGIGQFLKPQPRPAPRPDRVREPSAA